MKNLTVKNISTATVLLVAPNIRFRRELAPGRVVPLTEEEYEELSFDTGFASLLNSHYIKLNGVNEGEEVNEVQGSERIFSAEEIAKMFDKMDVTGFAKFIPTAAEAEKETAVKLAIEKGITNTGFTALIKKYCGVDVISAINMKHQAEEE